MKYPKLPEATVIDGRMFYTSGQMRDFGKRSVDLNSDFEPEDDYEEPITDKDKMNDFLFDILGVRK